MYEVICMDKRIGTGQDGNRLLSALCMFLCVFALLGAVYCFAPADGIKTVFPLLGGVSQRLDRVAWKLKTGSPIQEAAEAFIYEAFTGADSN